VITGTQIKAARAMLYWSATETAEKARLTRLTVERLEQHPGIPPSRAQTLASLQKVFEAAGIEFVGSPEEGPGVRLWGKGRGRAKEV